jgi:hypothetical protein
MARRLDAAEPTQTSSLLYHFLLGLGRSTVLKLVEHSGAGPARKSYSSESQNGKLLHEFAMLVQTYSSPVIFGESHLNY